MADLKRIARGVLRRVRARLQPGYTQTLIHAVKNEMVGQVGVVQNQLQVAEVGTRAIQDQAAMTGVRVEQLMAEVEQLRDGLAQTHADVMGRLAQIEPKVPLRTVEQVRLADIDQDTADFLNYSRSHRGPLADVGLWINDPVVIGFRAGDAFIGAVNERIVEHPFVHGAIGTLPPGSRILDIGGGESLVGLSLASLGHHVTVIEPAGYPYRHANLSVVEDRLETFAPEAPYDAVILLSAIEHFGIAAYSNNGEADPDADLAAMALVRDKFLAPGGLLVLTTPFGPAAVDELERTYDEARLRLLLDGFEIEQAQVATRTDPITWTVVGSDITTPAERGNVVLVRARRP